MMSEEAVPVPSTMRGFVPAEPNSNPNPNPNTNPALRKKRNLPGTPGKYIYTYRGLILLATSPYLYFSLFTTTIKFI